MASNYATRLGKVIKAHNELQNCHDEDWTELNTKFLTAILDLFKLARKEVSGMDDFLYDKLIKKYEVFLKKLLK